MIGRLLPWDFLADVTACNCVGRGAPSSSSTAEPRPYPSGISSGQSLHLSGAAKEKENAAGAGQSREQPEPHEEPPPVRTLIHTETRDLDLDEKIRAEYLRSPYGEADAEEEERRAREAEAHDWRARKDLEEQEAKQLERARARATIQQAIQEAKELEDMSAKEREEQAAKERENLAAKGTEDQAAKEKEEQAAKELEDQAANETEAQAVKEREEQAAKEREEQAAKETEEQAAKEREDRAAKEREEQAAKEKEKQAAKEREDQAAKEREEQAAKEREDQAAKETEVQAVRERDEQAAKEREKREKSSKGGRRAKEREEQALEDEEARTREEHKKSARKERKKTEELEKTKAEAYGPKAASAPPPSPRKLELDVEEWIEVVTGDAKGDRTFSDWLHDGQILCKLVNTIKPGIVANVNESDKKFQQMENISMFIGACRQLGVLEKDVFSPIDLHEEKNLTGVQRCILNLGAAIRRTAPEFEGPFLGAAQHAVLKDVVMAEHFTRSLAGEVAFGKTLSSRKPRMGEHGYVDPTSGAAMTEDQQVQVWIETVIDEKADPDQTLAQWLKDGQILCKLVNVIQPGSVPKINTQAMPFKQMENISGFLVAIRKLGVMEKDVFSTVDLYEEKNMQGVVRCIFSLGGAVQKYATFDGPPLGVTQSSGLREKQLHKTNAERIHM